MRKVLTIAGSALLLVTMTGTAIAAPRAADNGSGAQVREDNRQGPLTARQEARRKAAQELILSGKVTPNAKGVVTLADDKYYQAAVTGTGHIFTILSEFGDQGSGKLGTVPGPLHNQIPKPNRPVVDGQANTSFNAALPFDNSTHWKADFNRAAYLDLFFGSGDSFADFYTAQSSGVYTVAGDVTGFTGTTGGWITVPGNASVYGDNAVEDFGGAWQFIEDTGNSWYDAALVAFGGKAGVQAYLAQFDVWDRYDHDTDGNFDEPDGYIDHFQAVHAGEGEDAGGGAQGADAIWSHRWYLNQEDFGVTGPSEDARFGGSQIGDSGYWLGDYTVEAENGGLGVFAHEFAHDLGLPDLYDRVAGENGVAFWSLMSVGSWMSTGTEDIGTRPDYMGPWEKLQLGWLDYTVAAAGASTASLSPSAAIIVDVPDRAVVTDFVDLAGGHAWWTGNGDDLDSTLTRTIDLTGISSATVLVDAWYSIEDGYDYLYAEYSTDGENWTKVGAVTGSSNDAWKGLRFAIPGGASTDFRFRYDTDSNTNGGGAFLDNIVIKNGGTTLLQDDVESGAGDWIAAGGFKISTGSESVIGDRYYIAENRRYVGYDSGLEVGPYQFSFALTDPDKVEHFAFEDGLLVWVVDESYVDNDNSQHTGRGIALPVDARPIPFAYGDGTRPSNRRQPFDATFGLQAVPDGPTADPEGGTLPCAGLHKQYVGGTKKAPTLEYYCAWPTVVQRAAIAMFNDSGENAYWTSLNPQNSVKTAGTGLTIQVTAQRSNGTTVLALTAVPAAP